MIVFIYFFHFGDNIWLGYVWIFIVVPVKCRKQKRLFIYLFMAFFPLNRTIFFSVLYAYVNMYALRAIGISIVLNVHIVWSTKNVFAFR